MLFEFVQATESDKEYLLGLRYSTMVEHLLIAGQILSDEDHKERINYKYECTFLVFIERELIGAVKYQVLLNEVEIIQLQVDPKYQARGYGSGIVQQILNSEVSKMAKLSVLKNSPAVALYKRLGFNIVGEDEYEYHMQTGCH